MNLRFQGQLLLSSFLARTTLTARRFLLSEVATVTQFVSAQRLVLIVVAPMLSAGLATVAAILNRLVDVVLASFAALIIAMRFIWILWLLG